MICYSDEEKISLSRKLREGAGGKSSGSSGSKGSSPKPSPKPKPSPSNGNKPSNRDSSNDTNAMRKEQQSIREYNNKKNNNNKPSNKDSSNDTNAMRKEQQSIREYNKEYNNNLKYDSAINANSLRKEQQSIRKYNKEYNNNLKYDSAINANSLKQEQLAVRQINKYLNRNNESDANLMKQEQLRIRKINEYNEYLKANAAGLNGASYCIKNSTTGLYEAITIIDRIKGVSGDNLSQQKTDLAMQLGSLQALLIEANAKSKDIEKIVNNIMDVYTKFEKQQSSKKEIILNEYGKPDLKKWTAEAVIDYAEKEVNNYFTGLHKKQIKENLKNSKTIGEAIGYYQEIIGSTAANILYNFSKGMAKSFENVRDAIQAGYLQLRDGDWKNEKLKDAGKETTKSKFEESIHNILFSPTKVKDPKMEKLGTQDWNDWSIEENIKDLIEDKTTNWFNTNFKLNEKDQNGITRLEKFEKNSLLTESSLGGQVMQNFCQMVPNIVLGNVFGAAASLGTLYAKSFGSSAESAYNMGATIDDASTYAALSAGVEVFTEKMFGIVGGIVPKGSGWLDNVITYASKTGELLGGAVGEVFEEHLSNLAQPIIKSVTINRDSSIREMMKEDFLDAFKDTTLVTLGTTALCNLLGYSIGIIKASVDNKNVMEYYEKLPPGSKLLTDKIIKYDDTSTMLEIEKSQKSKESQPNPVNLELKDDVKLNGQDTNASIIMKYEPDWIKYKKIKNNLKNLVESEIKTRNIKRKITDNLGKLNTDNDRLEIVFDGDKGIYKYIKYEGYDAKEINYNKLDTISKEKLNLYNEQLKNNKGLYEIEKKEWQNQKRTEKLKEMGYSLGTIEVGFKGSGSINSNLYKYLIELATQKNNLLGLHRVGSHFNQNIQEDIFNNGLTIFGHLGINSSKTLSDSVSYYSDNDSVIAELLGAHGYKDSVGSILVSIPDSALEAGNDILIKTDKGTKLNPKYIVGYVPWYNGNHLENIIKNPNFEQSTTSEILNSNIIKQKLDQAIQNSTKYKLYWSTEFGSEFAEKYFDFNLEWSDIVDLNTEKIQILEQENAITHFKKTNNPLILDILGIKKTIDLYRNSRSDFEMISDIYKNYKNDKSISSFMENIKYSPVSEIKQICHDYLRNEIITSSKNIKIQDYSQKFIEENADIFLVNADIPEEIRNKYYTRSLTIDDVINNLDVFSNIPIEHFMELSEVQLFASELGEGGLQYILREHRDTFDHLRDENSFYKVTEKLGKGNSIEERFSKAIRKYFYSEYAESSIYYDEQGPYFDIPDWLNSLNFRTTSIYKSINELENYDSKTLLVDQCQRTIIETFGVDNLLRFEKSTRFFSYPTVFNGLGIDRINLLYKVLYCTDIKEIINISEKDDMTYSKFTDIMAMCLNEMRKSQISTIHQSYDFIEGEFRNNYPTIFMFKDAPSELKIAFYENKIDGKFLQQHKECIPYLIEKYKFLDQVLSGNFEVDCYYSNNQQQDSPSLEKINFIHYYSKLYGNEKLLELFSTYGFTDLSNSVFDLSADKEGIDKQYRDILYNRIITDFDFSYTHHLLSVDKFVKEHPDIFLTNEEINKVPENFREKFTKLFYEKNLSFEQIRQYPELIDVLKNKNLKMAFYCYNNYNLLDVDHDNSNSYSLSSEIDIIDIIGQEKFLELCSKYGRYLENIHKNLLITKNELDYNRLCSKIEDVIAERCLLGHIINYQTDAPEFLKQKMPNLFLDPNAPQELQDLFYGVNYKSLSFTDIANHKEWMEYLKDKSVVTSLLKNLNYSYNDIKMYFKLFGDEKGLKLGLQRTEIVEHMINSQQIELMKQWYDKTGQKFIPDFVVMETIPIEEAEKFLVSGQIWSKLMKIKSFSEKPESRIAMLKLAYTFGAFDQDQTGIKELLDLLTGVPRKYKPDDISKLKILEQEIQKYNKIIAEDPDASPTMPTGTIEYGYLIEELKKNNIKFTGESIFENIFNINSDMSATLKLNPQSYPKVIEYLRKILEQESIVLSVFEAIELFNEFNLKYDKDFREFLLKNIDEIRTNPEYIKHLSSIQQQFDLIKTFNSNRVLTLDTALSFVQYNKYENVNIGNYKVAEISAIANYTQQQFDILQKIYNYGKTRTFNSIPRIENATEKYTYEILRLDDPLAMAIGTLSDCCQALGQPAEVSMEHSMVDKNGRIFIIRDNQGNLIAQSWVWRNKDVLCFDNIEIPDKAFARAIKDNPELKRSGFANEIFEVYKQAAGELIRTDELVYKELLERGQISQEQYDGLRLGKVTVGLGWNDIAEVINKNAPKDTENISRPLPFQEPVKLSHTLYTSDSEIQYILEKRENRTKYDGETIPVYTDTLIEYTDDTFDEKMLYMLEKLEWVTKNNLEMSKTQLDEYKNKENIVSSLAKNYDFNPDTTRIIMNPNFAIIYEVDGNNIKIGDLLYNFSIDNKEQQIDITSDVMLQIKLAFDQISAGKSIDTSKLSAEQLEVYNKLETLNKENNFKKGEENE